MGKYDHLSQLELADHSDGTTLMEVDVLIGSDYYWEVVTGKVCRGTGGPVAIHTVLGWVLSGPAPLVGRKEQSVNLMTTHTRRVDSQTSTEDTLEESLHSFWKLKSLGIGVAEQPILEDFSKKI